MDTAERIRALVAPLVSAAGAELYDVEFAGGTLRIAVDRDGGADLEVIGRLTREISRTLDDQDPIAGHYTLEVSSPGLERNLRTPEHFARATGDLVVVKVRAGVDGERRVRGRLLAADDDGITVQPDDATPGTDPRRLGYGDVERARTVFEWGPAPKPGRARGGSSAPAKKKSTEKKAARS